MGRPRRRYRHQGRGLSRGRRPQARARAQGDLPRSLRLVDGQDRWNPLRNIDPADILYLQRTALALLPETTGRDEASAYFRNRAVDLISGAMIAAIAVGRPTPVR